MQQGFLKWAGFDVVATYGRPEELSPKKMQELINKGKEAGIKLVVDNLQSGPDAGAGIAEEIGAAQVISNFPRLGQGMRPLARLGHLPVGCATLLTLCLVNRIAAYTMLAELKNTGLIGEVFV